MSRNNVVCYDGIQRIYRNALVGFLRQVLTGAFPEDAVERLRVPFPQEEWDAVKRNASASRVSGQLDAKLSDDFDLLGVNHFFNIFDKYFDVIFRLEIEGTGIDNREKNRQKSKLLNWLKTIKDLRDPLSHPAEQDFTREDSFTLLDCARRVLLRVGLTAEADQIKALMGGLFESALSSTRVRDRLEDELPPRESVVVDFVGRDLELRELWEWFDDPVSRRWALAGAGGKGKSALAYNFAFDVKMKAPEPFQAILWLSAKQQRFLEGQVVVINEPDFFDLNTALTCLLKYYGWLEEIDNPIETRRKRVLELLNEFPALVIADDIDSINTENESVLEFFSLQVPETRSKVLFTSRRVIFGMGGMTTHVGGFSESDAEKFIHSRCDLMDLDRTTFDAKLVKTMVQMTEGSPLYIEDLMRLMSFMPPLKAINLWTDKGGAEARRYALGRECELLSRDALNVLLAASIPEGSTTFAEIEAVLGLAPERLTAALQELQKLFLVPKPRLVKSEQRFEVNRNTRALVRAVHGRSDVFRRIETAYKKVSTGITTVPRTDVAAVIRQSVFLVKANRHEEAETVLLEAIEKYHAESDLFGILGWVYKNWHPPRLTDARERFLRASQLGASKEEMYEHWCDMERRELEWLRGAEAAEKGLKTLKESKRLLFIAGYCRCRLGKELIGGLHREKGKRELNEAKKLLKRALVSPDTDQTRASNLNADIYRALVIICEQINDLEGLSYYFDLWKRKHPDDPDADSEWKRISRRYDLAESPNKVAQQADLRGDSF